MLSQARSTIATHGLTTRSCLVAAVATVFVISGIAIGQVVKRVPGDYAGIQAALMVAEPTGWVIEVAPGTWAGNLDFRGKAVHLKAVGDWRNTVLCGNGLDTVVRLEDTPQGCIIEGFTITGGRGVPLPSGYKFDSYGGGVYCQASQMSSYAMIRCCRLTGNGLPIQPSGSLPYPGATFGGGIFIGGGGPERACNVTLEHCIIDNNYAWACGGGVMVSGVGANARLEHCTVTNNTDTEFFGWASGIGGGNSSKLYVRNSIVWGNAQGAIAPFNGMYDGSTVFDVTFSVVTNGFEGMGNVKTNPNLVDPEHGNWGLRAGSAAMNMGDPKSPLDADGTRADAGAWSRMGPLLADQDVHYFMLGRPGASPDLAIRVLTTKNELLERTVVSAIDSADRLDELNTVRAVNAALLKSDKESVQIIATRFGMGVVAIGRAQYTVDESSPERSASLRRAASVEAHINAITELAKFVKALPVQAQKDLLLGMATIGASDLKMTTLRERADASRASLLEAFIRGAVAFDCRSDQDAGSVTVSVLANAKSASAIQCTGAGVIAAQTLEEAVAQVHTEIELGVSPVLGGKLVLVPATGQFSWIGVCSAYAAPSEDPVRERNQRAAAGKLALSKLRSAFLNIIKGSPSKPKDTEAVARDAQAARFAEAHGLVREAREALACGKVWASRVTSATFEGNLPADTAVVEYERNRWYHAVAVLAPKYKAPPEQMGKIVAAESPLRSKVRPDTAGYLVKLDGSFQVDETGNLVSESKAGGIESTGSSK